MYFFRTFCGVCALSVVSSAVQPWILLTSFLNLPVSGVIINIQKVSCSVSLLLSVVCGNLLSRLQTFITINLVRVADCPYVCRCGQTTGNSRLYKNNKDN